MADDPVMRFRSFLVAVSLLLPGCSAGFDLLSSRAERLWNRHSPLMFCMDVVRQQSVRSQRIGLHAWILAKQINVRIIQEAPLVEGGGGGDLWYRVQSDLVEKIDLRIQWDDHPLPRL